MSSPGAASVDALVEAGGANTALVMARVEERMVELVSDHGEPLARHGGETISAGGKRLRPLLVCIACGVPVAQSDELVPAEVVGAAFHVADAEVAEQRLEKRHVAEEKRRHGDAGTGTRRCRDAEDVGTRRYRDAGTWGQELI